MSPKKSTSLLLIAALLALLGWTAASLNGQAAPDAGAAPPRAPAQQGAMVDLINRLVARGSLSKQDAAELIAQAEADSADSRVQAAEVLLATAKADAAAARAQAALSQAQAAVGQAEEARASVARMAEAQREAARILMGGTLPATVPTAAQSIPVNVPEPQAAAPAPPEPVVVAAPAQAPPPAAPYVQPSLETTAAPVAAVPQEAPIPVTTVPADPSQLPVATAAEAPAVGGSTPAVAAEAPVEAQREAPAAAPAQTGATVAQPAQASAAPSGSDDTVRVAYVPEVVKNELREEVKDDLLAEARKEGWGGTQPVPGWVSRFTLYGDIRVRYEFLFNHKTNDNSGNAFPNFNAINTGSPFDLAGNVSEPQYNVDQDRERMRLRARMGETVDLADGFTAGLRLATGNDDQPVSENQTLGAAGTGQGGDFSKYALWLDRAYIKYQTGGDPTRDISLTLGRFDDPFFGTSLVWATDLAFDGIAASIPFKVHRNGRVVDSVKPFLVGGVFPVFNTDLNFATDNAAKFPSYDKWLEAVQAGASWTGGRDLSFKAAAAYYYYKNVEGRLSTPFTPLTSSDAGNTDASRPSFAQNGNTYMEIRDIVPGPLNNNGTTDQFQYFGLATPFHEMAFDFRADYNHFEPFQVSLVGEFVENRAFNANAIAAVAVNNQGTAPSGGGTAPFIGGNKGWNTTLKLGDAVLQKRGDWNVGVGYRYLESDAVVDGFTDADFGGDLLGTNLKGYTLDGSVVLAPGVILESKLMSATDIAGPSYKNDYLQFDINAKF